jgi:hypothetical protein
VLAVAFQVVVASQVVAVFQVLAAFQLVDLEVVEVVAEVAQEVEVINLLIFRLWLRFSSSDSRTLAIEMAIIIYFIGRSIVFKMSSSNLIIKYSSRELYLLIAPFPVLYQFAKIDVSLMNEWNSSIPLNSQSAHDQYTKRSTQLSCLFMLLLTNSKMTGKDF